MKINLSDKQWREIQFALCIAMSHTEKITNISVEEHPVLKKYIKIYDQITEVRNWHKINNSWIKVLQGEKQ